MIQSAGVWFWVGAIPALVLAFLLWRERAQRRQLLDWLRDPVGRAIPEGNGAWRDVFSLLQRWRKADQRAMGQLDSGLQRFRQAAQAIPDGVVLLDGDSRIEWLNAAAGRQLGLDPERDPGTLVHQLVRQPGFEEYLQGFRAEPATQPLIFQNGSDAARRTISVLLVAFDRSGILLLSRDISDVARGEAVRRDFIANVSHELRTPLTVISGFLEHMLAADSGYSSETRKFLGLMDEQARRMNRLVADLLTLSRLEATGEPAREESVDVPALLQTLLAEARALSAGCHLIELEELQAVGATGSADEIRSAFGNLLSNAIRYTPDGGRIGVSWRQEGTHLVFSVSDTGIGIPAESIARLTERFYRVDKGRSAATGGTGLGLAIVKHVLVRHQGQLVIESTVGKGSRFTAYLPSKRAITVSAIN